MFPSDMQIKKIDDINGLDLEFLVTLDSMIFSDPWSRKQWQAEVRNSSNEVEIVYTKAPQSIPVAFLSYGRSGNDIEVKKVGVLPEFRRQGIAALLLGHLIEQAISSGSYNIFAETSVTNSSAIKLYEKFSFHRISVRKKYYNNKVDALLLQKEI